MIAMRAPQPEPPARQFERGRNATHGRRRRARRRAAIAFARVVAVAAAVVLPIMLYVMLTANITTINYKLARAQAHKTELLALTMRQEDQIAKLESRERLAQIAARLGMHEPQTFAVAALPADPGPPPAARGVALLGAMNTWLTAAPGDAGK
jgi:cell division protein FtsL